MKTQNGQTMSTGQLFVLIFSIGSCLKMLMLPVLLLKSSGRNATVSLLCILLGELLCLAVLGIAMKKAPNKSFLTLVREAMGKVGVKIISAVLFVFFFLKILLLCNEARIFFSEGFLSESPWSIYALPLVAFCVLFGMGTARQIGRCAQCLFPFIAVSSFIIFILVSSGADFGDLLPLFEGAKMPVAKAAVRYAIWYGDYSTLMAFFGSVKRTKRTLLLTNLAGLVAFASVLFFAVGLFAAFADISELLRFGQNVAGLARFSLLGPASGRFDLLVFCVWLLSAFIKAGTFMYAASTFLSGLLGISRGVASVSTGILLYAMILFGGSSIALRAFFGRIGGIMFVLQIILPLLALILSLLSARREKKKGGNDPQADEDGAASETVLLQADEDAQEEKPVFGRSEKENGGMPNET